jgi:hypothetical protein
VGACSCGAKFRIPAAPAAAKVVRRAAPKDDDDDDIVEAVEVVRGPKPAARKQTGPKPPPPDEDEDEGVAVVRKKPIAPPKPVEPVGGGAADDDDGSTPYGVVKDPEPPPEKKRKKSADDEDEDIDLIGIDKEYLKRKKKIKKKHKQSEKWIPGVPNVVIGLLVIFLFWAGLGVAAVKWPDPMALALFGFGAFIACFGRIWFLKVAWEEGEIAYVLIIPFYSLYFAVVHWESSWKPLLVQMFGVAIMVSAVPLGVLGALLGDGDFGDFGDEARRRAVPVVVAQR